MDFSNVRNKQGKGHTLFISRKGVPSCEEPVKLPGRSCLTPSNRDKMNWESESSLFLCFFGGGSSFL